MEYDSEMERRSYDDASRGGVTRRQFLVGASSLAALLALGPLTAGCGEGTTSASTSSPPTNKPKKGGNLRVAMLGGTPSDTLDPNNTAQQVDNLRVMALFNGLVQLTPDAKIVNVLADEMTPSKDASTWTIRLKQGVTFHNGKTLDAKDVIFTLQRIMDPKNPLVGAGALKPLDPQGMKVLDSRTLELKMLTPYSSFPEQICSLYFFGIVPVDFDPKNPVGTGPFKVSSFTAGQQSVFGRNENYFRTGLPYLDQLTIIDSYASDAAAQNALLGGEVDAYTQAPLALAKQLAGNSAIKELPSQPCQWVPLTMRVDQKPFDDVRVRQAFRLLVDREQVVKVALDGLAVVGNDVFCPNDPSSDRSLVRHQDLEQAKSLLKQAGQENMSVELVTADFAAGAVATAQVFAQQAKAVGVNVKISNIPVGTFYGPNYLKWTFAQDFWGNPPYLGTVSQGEIPGSYFNETHFDNPRFNALYAEANATIDEAKQTEIIHEMQAIEFNEGGYIIPTFNRLLDLLSPRVSGLQPSATGLPMGNGDWENAWLA